MQKIRVVDAKYKLMEINAFKLVCTNTTQRCSTLVTLKHWTNDLNKQSGTHISLLNEDDEEIPPPPTFVEMMTEIGKMKSGKTPGLHELSSDE